MVIDIIFARIDFYLECADIAISKRSGEELYSPQKTSSYDSKSKQEWQLAVMYI